MAAPDKNKNSEREKIAYYINDNYPITGAIVYEGGVIEIVRGNRTLSGEHTPRKGQNTVKKLSQKSLNRLAFVCCVNSGKFHSMLTLTYGMEFPINGGQAKDDLNRFLVWFRRKFEKPSYVWFLEFQRRGAPHFHIMSSVFPPTPHDLRLTAEAWVIATGASDTLYSSLRDRKVRNQRVAMMEFSAQNSEFFAPIRSKDGAKKYVLKYALKTRQKVVPEMYSTVGRFWGNSRDCGNQGGLKIEVTESDIRRYLKTNVERLDGVLVVPKYIF